MRALGRRRGPRGGWERNRAVSPSARGPNAWRRAAAARRAGMKRPLSIAHLSALDAGPTELIEIAARCDCDFVGLRLLPVTVHDAPSPLIADPALRRETRRRAADSGVAVLDVELFRLSGETAAADFEPALAAAHELGARHALTQVHDAVETRAIENFAALCELAASYQLTCDIEFLSWTAMRDVATAKRFLVAADQPNGGICIDTLHFWRSGCEPSEIDQLPRRWLNFVQISDARGPVRATPEEMIRVAREDRLMPGEGEIDLKAIIARLPPDTPLALEIPNTQLAKHISHEDRMRLARAKLIEVLCGLEDSAAA